MSDKSFSRKVQRAAAAGSSKHYREARPWGYYTILIVIFVLGISGIVYSKIQLDANSTKDTAPPTVGTTWHEALGFYICSKFVKLPPTPKSSNVGFRLASNQVLTISPKNNSEAGKNANLQTFVNEYPGLVLSTSELQLPNSNKVYHNGDKCPGSKKPGKIYFREFGSASDKVGFNLTGKPSDVAFQDGALLTIAFVPAGSAIPPPPSASSLPATTTTLAGSQGGVSSVVTAPPATISHVSPSSTQAQSPSTTNGTKPSAK